MKKKETYKRTFDRLTVYWSHDMIKKGSGFIVKRALATIFWVMLRVLKYCVVFGAGGYFGIIFMKTLAKGYDADLAKLVTTGLLAAACVILFFIFIFFDTLDGIKELRGRYTDRAEDEEKMHRLSHSTITYVKVYQNGAVRFDTEDDQKVIDIYYLKPAAYHLIRGIDTAKYDMDKNELFIPYVKPED